MAAPQFIFKVTGSNGDENWINVKDRMLNLSFHSALPVGEQWVLILGGATFSPELRFPTKADAEVAAEIWAARIEAVQR